MARDVSVVFRVVDAVTAPIREINSRIKGMVDGISGLFKGLTAGIAAAGVFRFFDAAIDGAVESERSVSRLDTVLQTLGLSYRGVESDVEAFLDKLQRTTRFSDEDGREALTTLLTITGDYQKSLDLWQLSADVAAKRQIAMAEGAEIVGKASIGVVKGLGDLGVVTTDANEALGQLRANVGGFAAAEGQTFEGRTKILGNLWGEFQEKLGAAIIGSDSLKGSMGSLADMLVRAAEWIEKNSATIGQFVNVTVQAGAAVGRVVGFLAKWGDLGEALGVPWKKGSEAAGKFADRVAAAETTATTTTQAQGTRRVTLTKAELAAREKAEKEAEAERDRARKEAAKRAEQAKKDSAKALEEIETIAFRGSLDLLNAQQREYQEAVRVFDEKMQRMSAADRAKAEALLQAHLANLLLKWAGFTDAMTPALKAHIHHEEAIQLQASSLDDLTGALDRYAAHTVTATGAADVAWASSQAVRQRIADVADETARAAGEMGAFLDALGASTPETDTFIAGIQGISDAIGKIAIGDTLGGIQAGLAGIGQFARLAFGAESASARAVRVALEKTQGKLEDHKRRLGDLIEISRPGRQLGGVEAALGGIRFDRFSDKDFARDSNDKALRGFLGKALMDRGLTMKDLEDVAAAYGADIRDDKGRLNAKLLQRLFDLLQNSEVGFSNTLSGQLDRVRQGKQLGVVTDELGALLEVINDPTVGVPALADALRGIDTGTQQGRQQALAAVQGLFEKLGTPGAISKAALGGADEGLFRQLLATFGELLTAGLDELPVVRPSFSTDAPGAADNGPAPDEALGPDGSPASLDLFVSMDHHLAEIASGITRLAASDARTAEGGRGGAGVTVAIDQLVLDGTNLRQAEDLLDALFDRVQGRAAEEYRMYRRGLGTEVTT